MTERGRRDDGPGAARGRADDASADLRLGRHAIGLLRAARDTGDPSLIAQAEALAMAAGLALARRLREEGRPVGS